MLASDCRSALSLFAEIAITGVGMKCSGSVPGCSEDEHVKWVEHILEQMVHVKTRDEAK
jgi:hypothetical protein